MADFFVVAEEEIVLAFRMVGVDGRAASGREEALDAFRLATGTGADPSGRPYRGMGVKVLILTEESPICSRPRPWNGSSREAFRLIVEIPSQGRPRPGRKSLVDLVREAVGVGI